MRKFESKCKNNSLCYFLHALRRKLNDKITKSASLHSLDLVKVNHTFLGYTIFTRCQQHLRGYITNSRG